MEPMKDYTTQELSQLLQNRQFRTLREIFEEYNVVDLAALVDRMPVDEITALFKILPKDKGAELLSYLDPDILEELTTNFTAAQIGGLLEHLFIDDLSDILSELPDELVKKVLSLIHI
jgi:magnesium transporter